MGNNVNNERVQLNIVEVDFCDDQRKEKVLLKNRLELGNKRFLSKIPFTSFGTYYRLWIEYEDADKNLEIANKEELITLKSENQKGKKLKNIQLDKNSAIYEIVFDPKQIKNFKGENSDNSKSYIDFTVKGKASHKTPDVEVIGKYRQEILLLRCQPKISIDLKIEHDGVSKCWRNQDGFCPLAKATIRTEANAQFCYPVDLTLSCKIEGREHTPKVAFSKPEEIDFRTAKKTHDTENYSYHYKDNNGNTFKIPDRHKTPSDHIEIRQLMPDNEFIIPIYIDAAQISGNCFDVQKLTIEHTILYDLSKKKQDKVVTPLRICHQVNFSSV
jgi:hypothetical protein